IGGGKIIDALPEKHRLKDSQVVPRLARLALADEVEQTAIFIEMQGARGLTLSELGARSGLTDLQLSRCLEELVRQGRILRTETQGTLLAKSAYEHLKAGVLDELKRYHSQEPLHAGSSREQVRERVFATLAQEIFKLVIDRLAGEKLIVAERDILRL